MAWLRDIVPSNSYVDPLDFRYPYDTDSHGCYVYRGIGSFVDGSNHQAEFYLIKWTGGNSTVKAYD
ncbi:MAG: hypothetical protein J2P17_02490 [Mycobacterium sp.]|nr:hypothetical protein [Mycobacterium sp.]